VALMSYLITPGKGLLSLDSAPFSRQTRRDWQIQDQIRRWRNSRSGALDRATLLRLPACHASASTAEGEGLCGNLFS
jgi:hypothetical protein